MFIGFTFLVVEKGATRTFGVQNPETFGPYKKMIYGRDVVIEGVFIGDSFEGFVDEFIRTRTTCEFFGEIGADEDDDKGDDGGEEREIHPFATIANKKGGDEEDESDKR